MNIVKLKDSLDTEAYYRNNYDIFKNNDHIEFESVNQKELAGKKFRGAYLGSYKTTYSKDGEYLPIHKISIANNFYTSKRPFVSSARNYGMWGYIEDKDGKFEFNPDVGFQEISEIQEEKLQKKINSNSYKIRNSKSVQKTSDFLGDVWYLIKVIIFIFLFFQLIGMSTWPN